MTRSFWMLVALLAALGGLRVSPFLLLAALLLTALGAVVHLWGRYALRGVECRRTVTPTHVEVGGTARVEIEVVNAKGLPLPWLRVDAPLPAALRTEFDGESDRPVSYLMRLAPNDRVTERVDVRVQGRGVHDLGPIWLRTADPLGFKIVRSRMPTEDRIVGLPALVPLERLLGRQERSLGWETEGGTGSGGLSAGWTDGDLIHQLLSGSPVSDGVDITHRSVSMPPDGAARHGSMGSRDGSINAHASLVVIPDLHEISEREGEWVSSAARSIAKAALTAGYDVGLETGAFRPGTRRRILVRAGRSPEQELRIAEALAAMSSLENLPMFQVLRRAVRRHDTETSILIISARRVGVSERLTRSIVDVGVASAGDSSSGHTIRVLHLPPPDPAYVVPGSAPAVVPATRSSIDTVIDTVPRAGGKVPAGRAPSPRSFFPSASVGSSAATRAAKDDFESWNRTVFLPLARLLLRLSWVWPWTVLLSQIAIPGMEPGVSLGALILLSWTGHAMGRLRLHGRKRTIAWAPFFIITVGVAAVLAVSWLLTYRTMVPIWELAWMRDLGLELLQGGAITVRRAVAIVAAVFVCVGAALDAEEPSDHASIWSAFISAIILVISQAAIVEFASDPRVHAPTSWLLFAFTVGLLALIASGVRLGHRLEPKVRRPWQPG